MAIRVGVLILLGAALRSGDRPASQRLGVCAGIIVLLVGCAVGFVMISNNSGVYQGSVGSGFANRASTYMGPSPMTIGQEYLLLRPSTDGGDLVLLHAIGVHGLVLLAVPAVLLARSAMTPIRQLQVIGVTVVGVAVAMAILLVQAFRQLPLDRLHPLALAALAVCTVALLAADAKRRMSHMRGDERWQR